jgi:hypothetical protein
MLRAGIRIKTTSAARLSSLAGRVESLLTNRRRNAMRLANRVLFCALAIFILSALANAQTPRGENDPRNLSPSVGTGGPEGGPTGLFTIYDGQTLRRGEYTFSFAMSNFDRDPGNADITDWPVSFNVGLNDHLELFFKTNAYRGIKVNNPQNLSGFYLPDVGGYFGAGLLGSGPAIILAPGNSGSLAGTAVFRPPFCPQCAPTGPLAVYYSAGQPFVTYPYTGGTGPNFGLGPGAIGTLFGFPGFNSTLGPPTSVGNTFGHADSFPGVGSPVGSILPGIVLATTQLPCTALTGNCRPPGSPTSLNPIVVPVTWTTSPSYLPDAPFVSRLYGESSFTNFVFGAKWRLTGPRNPFGFGFIPMYRWYADKPTTADGFRQLQRGASPGGSIGDFGLTMFADARLSRSVNVSANLGYWLNSNPKNGNTTLLDRPDEIIAGVGIDFPINRWFQGIGEFRSTQYVGGHTPNAFPNNPVEFLVGAKIYPARWWGIGAWYRRSLNQQSLKHFNGVDVNTAIQQITNVNVPGRGLVIVPGTTIASTSGGFPLGFQPSDDPNGFGAQLWIGHRNKREPAVLPNQPPVISSFTASASSITLPCPPDMHSRGGACPTAASSTVQLTTTASDPDGDTLLYTYSVTGGRVTGDGANVSWDLSGVGPGTYTASVEVDDGCGCITAATTTVTIASCSDCIPNVVCPAISSSCPDAVDPGQSITFTATVGNGTPPASGYNWTVSAGTITSGQGTTSITVSTTDAMAGQSVTASLDVVGLDPSCPHTTSCTTNVRLPAKPARKFDEYGNIRFNDEKARLDNFAVQLQNEPGSTGYIIGYGSCDAEGLTRANRAKDYLVNTRGIDASRIMVVDGGCRSELLVQLWIAPQGAAAPTGDATGVMPTCPDCKKKAARRRGRGRGEE